MASFVRQLQQQWSRISHEAGRRLPRPKGRRTLILAAAGSVVGVVVAVLVNLITMHWNWWLFAGLILVTGIAAVVAALSTGSSSPPAREWLNGLPIHGWILEQIREALDKPILIPIKQAYRALADAERAHAEYSRPEHVAEFQHRLEAERQRPIGKRERVRRPEFVHLEEMLRLVILVLRPDSEYLKALRALPPGYAAHALKTGYSRKAPVDDFWAYDYLLLLKNLGEKDTLLPLLEERLKDASITEKAALATLKLVRDVLGPSSYHSWLDRVDLPDSYHSWLDRPDLA